MHIKGIAYRYKKNIFKNIKTFVCAVFMDSVMSVGNI